MIDANIDNLTITVLGAGGWGTALALVLTSKGLPVRLWEFRTKAAQKLRFDRENKEFLPGIPLPKSITIYDDAAECLKNADGKQPRLA